MMVLVETLILASSGLLSVGSITLVILLLMSEAGWRNGLAYAVGYTGAYSVIGVAAVVVGYRATQDTGGEAGPILPILLVVLGTVLLWLALRNWRKAPAEPAGPPRLFAMVDGVTAPRAFAFGALVTVINFKNLGLFLTALSVTVLSDLPLGQKVIVALLAAVVFSLAVISPVAVYLAFPRRADDLLGAFKGALERHRRPAGIWLPLAFGLLFVARGIALLR